MLERRSDRPGIPLVDTAAEPRTTAGLIRVHRFRMTEY
jgi:hypothetical protein